MLVITALNTLHRLLKVKDKLPFSFSGFFFQRILLNQHTTVMFVIYFGGSWDCERIKLSSKYESIRKKDSPEACKFLLYLSHL